MPPHLNEDHPGFGDPVYRARRNHIAARALRWDPGPPADATPQVDYTDAEQEVWRTVCRELAAKHERLAGADYRQAMASLALPADHVPQLDEVSDRLRPLTGCEYHPAAGLVGFDHLLHVVGGFFAGCDDDSPARLSAVRSGRT
ncbi:MAG TPA: hypothetical protein VHV28_04390 [Solirubrobacteraceae bacterium]|nr:hypothetical protein [Solirubrobacteraceae bacterium]